MRPDIGLQPDEEVLFEDDSTILTTRRLVGNFASGRDGGFDSCELRDIGPPDKFNGGYQSRRPLGIQLFVAGAAVVILSAMIRQWFENMFVEAALFLVGSLAATVGAYLLLNSLFRNAPNTTVIFPVIQGEDIVASYPEWDNPKADELIRNFARAKRGLGR